MKLVLEAEVADGVAFQSVSPAIVYSVERLRRRVQALAGVSLAESVCLLLAVKAAPDSRCLAAVAALVQGFDLSNVDELHDVAEYIEGRTVSFTGPVCTRGLRENLPEAAGQVIVNAESSNQLTEARNLLVGNMTVGIRLRSKIPHLRKDESPAFGFEEAHLASLFAADPTACAAVRAVHVHGSSRENTTDTIVARAGMCLEDARGLGLNLTHANYGGGFSGLTVEQFRQCLSRLTSLSGGDVTTFIEPGEFVYEGCGWAEATVLDVSATGVGARAVLDVSRECHVRWSKVDQEGLDRRESGNDCLVDFVGPTCIRGDFLGRRWCRRALGRPLGVRVGDRIRLAGITSYSAPWNLSFNGIRAAPVVLLDE